MTKKELVVWLKKKHTEAHNKVVDVFKQKEENYKKKIFEDIELDRHSKIIYRDIETLRSHFADLQANINKHPTEKLGIRRYAYRSIFEFLDVYKTESDVFSSLDNIIRYNNGKDVFRFEDERHAALSNVDSTYSNLISNVSAMKDAKTAIEYLQSLGFTDIEAINSTKEITALATPIDTRWLMLNKEV